MVMVTDVLPSARVELDPAFLHAFRTGRLTEDQAQQFLDRDPIEVRLLLLELSAAIAAKRSPHAPPSALAPFENSSPKGKRARKRGAKPGHQGHSRAKPERIDHQVEHQLPACPDCGGELTRTKRTRTRIIEDIPNDLKAEATEHTLHRDWCPCCKKQVEPVVPDALPACTLGNQAVTLSAFLHYGIGTSTQQVVDVFNAHLQLKITPGGLTQMWHRLAETLKPWYEQIWDDCLKSAVLHGDETGWHLNGVLVWLWCFCTKRSTFYAIDESRGHAALNTFFTEAFDGILVTDFWRAYDAVDARMNQKCWAHLLRELTAVEERPNGPRDDWIDFAKKLRRISTDAVKLAAAGDALPEAERDAKVCRLHTRMTDLAVASWCHPDAARLAKRLRKDGVDLLTFAEFPEVPATNNAAEREIRPAVLMRKVSYGSGSVRGAATRAILMSIYRTLKARGLDPLAETRRALQTLAQTGTLPPLPDNPSSAG
jgi:transposase